MKIIFLIFFVLISAVQLLSQGIYPLQIGNIWQYRDTDPFSSYGWQAEIVGDTTLQNGITYSIYFSSGFGSDFLRQEGSKVFAYDLVDSTEFVLFDFSASVDDTISIYHNYSRTIVLRAIFENQPSLQWVFDEYWGDSIYSYIFSSWTITDSIGLTWLTGEPGITFHLIGAKINGVIIGTLTGVDVQNGLIPANVTLMQNYPNPFNPTTNIEFQITDFGFVSLKIFDLLGREVITLINEEKPAGIYKIEFDGNELPNGIYFYRLISSRYTETKKMILLR